MKSECCTSDGSCQSHHHCWCKIAIAFGLANALGLLVMGLLGTYNGYGLMMISTIGSIYPGYAPTVAGSFIGAFWGFLDVFIFFIVAGIIYRVMKKCCNKCYCFGSSCSTGSTGECATKSECCDKEKE